MVSVYMDACLFPRILDPQQGPQILKQEGWHYEVSDVDAPLKYKVGDYTYTHALLLRAVLLRAVLLRVSAERAAAERASAENAAAENAMACD